MARPFREQRHRDLCWIRPKFIALTKGMRGSRKIRGELSSVVTLEDLRVVAEKHCERFGEKLPPEPALDKSTAVDTA